MSFTARERDARAAKREEIVDRLTQVQSALLHLSYEIPALARDIAAIRDLVTQTPAQEEPDDTPE